MNDELVMLKNKDPRANYHEVMRRVRALVEVDDISTAPSLA
jgi:hypothetical protein